jgi:hypothetical protein
LKFRQYRRTFLPAELSLNREAPCESF